MWEISRTERFDAPLASAPWILFAILDRVVASAAPSWANATLESYELQTSHGDVARPSLAELEAVAGVIGGELSYIRSQYRRQVDNGEYLLRVVITSPWRDSEPWRASLRVKGPDDYATVGLATTLATRLAEAAQEYGNSLPKVTPPAPVALNRAVADPPVNIPEAESERPPLPITQIEVLPALEARSRSQQASAESSAVMKPTKVRAKVKIPTYTSIDFVRLSNDALFQVEEELKRFGKVDISGETFEGAPSVDALVESDFARLQDFTMEATSAGAYTAGVRVRFSKYDVSVSTTEQSPDARATYARVVEVLRAHQSRKLIRLRSIAVFSGLVCFGIYLGFVLRSIGSRDKDVPTVSGVFFLIAIATIMLSGVLAGLISIWERPRVTVGTTRSSWFRASISQLALILVSSIAGATALAAFAYLGIKH